MLSQLVFGLLYYTIYISIALLVLILVYVLFIARRDLGSAGHFSRLGQWGLMQYGQGADPTFMGTAASTRV